jgi:hypothetical protein
MSIIFRSDFQASEKNASMTKAMVGKPATKTQRTDIFMEIMRESIEIPSSVGSHGVRLI